ncbi:hypothetical protein NRIC_26640 [Enterococcus florum]|uniref:Class C sortase n=1 Tax=Enterococcus florum TaxID=2480627 RepID=A0A4P5PNN6_9ENTE|nr:class C sortase [Enterococcus florum]GCF94773.1 hypothetical protein NRIC_26640 [Enterococcus florum]
MKKPFKNNQKLEIGLNLFMAGLILAGVLILMYPFVSDSLNHAINQQRLEYYQEKTDKRTAEKRKQRMKIHNQTLKKQKAIAVMDPFEEKGTQSKKGNSFTEHIIGSILIPKIKVNIPIYDQISETYLEEGAALLNGTSFPLGGKNTHAVISAHRGLPDKKFFTDLPELKIGDTFILHVVDEKLAYKVDKIDVVEPTDKTWLSIEEGRDIVTLMTCTPYMVNTHRLLVTGHRIPYTAKMDKESKKINRQQTGRLTFYILLGVTAVIAFLCFAFWIKKNEKEKKR